MSQGGDAPDGRPAYRRAAAWLAAGAATAGCRSPAVLDPACAALGAAHRARARSRPGEGQGAVAPRAVAWAGVGLSLFFALLIAGTDVPGWLLDPCE